MNIITLVENTASRAGLLAEWGLSILIEVDGLKVLLDTGQSAALVHNAPILGIDLSTIDKIILSHGHYDHTGGLRQLLKSIRKKVEIIAHPDIWDLKYAQHPDKKGYTYIGIPYRREELESLGASFTLTDKPVWITERIVTTGEIPMLTDYEKIDTNLYIKGDHEIVPDPLRDDMALIIKTDHGLVIASGCAHRGIINTIHQAQKLTGGRLINTVVGGTHLLHATEEQIKWTIAQFKEINVKRVGASHCTGFHTSIRLAEELGDSFLPNNAGTYLHLP